jgi:beta-glucosidase
MALRRSQLHALAGRDNFFWATGIEDTFITAPYAATGRTLDEYELTEHYERWRGDLELMKELGVRTARYGIPWHRVQPTPRKWNWKFADSTLERMLELGIDPIVDLVHYGLPPWLDRAYLDPDFPQRMSEYAARLAERFRGRIHWYTPLNEPRITAWYCGRIGWWPPALRGWRGFVSVMLAICRGIVMTIEALARVDREIVPVHVDATDFYESDDPKLADEVARRQHIVFLALDLVSGRVTEKHPLHDWLLRQGATRAELEWFIARAVDLPLIGMNMYPMFSWKRLVRTNRGLRIRMQYAPGDIVDRITQQYWDHYRRPLFISEIASVGSVARRSTWLRDSVEAVRRIRARGIPLVGYTWWPLFALVTWAHRQGRHPVAYYLKQMGLWDLDSNLDRIRTPLVDEYRALVSGGTASVGRLASERRRAVA